MFPDDDSALGPFLGNLPPEILDDVVQKLGWFRTTFAMARKTCREVVERVSSTRALLTDRERGRLRSPEMTPLAVAVVEGDVEAVEWLMQLFDGKGLKWRDVGGCRRRRGTLSHGRRARQDREPDVLTRQSVPVGLEDVLGRGAPLKVLQWARRERCEWFDTCESARGEATWGVAVGARERVPVGRGDVEAAAGGGHLKVLRWARQKRCPWDARRDAEGVAARGTRRGHG